MDKVCKICGNSVNNTSFVAREMMLGFRDEFEYFQCSECECLQIAEIPENQQKYYPDNYYSFIKPKISRFKNYLWYFKHKRTLYYLNGEDTIGSILTKLFGKPNLPDWIKYVKLHVDSKILDVGCGAGDLLISLQQEGFSDLTGFDPYIQEDLYYENGVRVLKSGLGEPGEYFDFIMLHHSFEHVPDPIDLLKTIYEKIVYSGLVLVRIPVVSSFAWKKYKTNWVQLDAPRHLFLHSIKSMELLSKLAGFRVESVEFDSSAFQFWGSEQIIENIPFNDPKSYKNGINNSIFTENDIKRYSAEAEELNLAKSGDQACFLLRKIDS